MVGYRFSATPSIWKKIQFLWVLWYQQVTSFPDLISNIVFPTSLIQEYPESFVEKITTREISHAPHDLLRNEILVVNGSDDEKYF